MVNVKQHTRQNKSGKVTQVRSYNRKKAVEGLKKAVRSQRLVDLGYYDEGYAEGAKAQKLLNQSKAVPGAVLQALDKHKEEMEKIDSFNSFENKFEKR